MKKIFLRFLSVLLALQGFMAVQLITAVSVEASNGVSGVVINEVVWAGSTAGSTDQWIELHNRSSETIDLSGWTITGVRSGDTPNYTFVSGVIDPGSYALVGRQSAETILSYSLDYPVADFYLSLSCSEISLRDNGDNQVDIMGCNGDSTYFGGGVSPFRSMERRFGAPSGLESSSWQTSISQVNINGGSDNFASPWSLNRSLVAGEIRDGQGSVDQDITRVDDQFSANWDGFSSLVSNIQGYEVAIGYDSSCSSLLPIYDDAGWHGVALETEYTFYISLIPGLYFSCVRATAFSGEQLTVASDGIIVDDASGSIVVTELSLSNPVSNGDRLLVEWNTSSISEGKIAEFAISLTNGFSNTYLALPGDSSLEIEGLSNGVEYLIDIVARDEAGYESFARIGSEKTLDNLAPTLDPNRIIVRQNNPGTVDTIEALPGVSSEVADLVVTSLHPDNPAAVTILSIGVDVDSGFSPQSVGDNLYDKLHVQLIDLAGNRSEVFVFDNDIVGPNAPTLSSAVATCFTARCQVELRWVDNGPDTSYYTVRYQEGGVERITAPIYVTSLVLNLPADRSLQEFTVQAFDQYGNPSLPSNAFRAVMVSGVVTTGSLVDGQLEVSTSALPGSRETVRSGSPDTSLSIAPPASAAEDDSQVAGSQDWLRIVLAVIVLLIIAASFYSLSRSMSKSSLDVPAKPEPPAKKKTTTKKKRGPSKKKS